MTTTIFMLLLALLFAAVCTMAAIDRRETISQRDELLKRVVQFKDEYAMASAAGRAALIPVCDNLCAELIQNSLVSEYKALREWVSVS